MKRKYLCIPCLCAVLCIIIIILAGAAENPEIKTVEQLLQKRTVIMENIIWGKITYEDGKQKLREVESGNLYRSDLNSVFDYVDSDLEEVEGVKVIYLEKQGQVCDIIDFKGKIEWTCKGYEGAYRIEDVYNIGVSVKDGEYRLVSLQLQRGE